MKKLASRIPFGFVQDLVEVHTKHRVKLSVISVCKALGSLRVRGDVRERMNRMILAHPDLYVGERSLKRQRLEAIRASDKNESLPALITASERHAHLADNHAEYAGHFGVAANQLERKQKAA